MFVVCIVSTECCYNCCQLAFVNARVWLTHLHENSDEEFLLIFVRKLNKQ